jgi:beta-phosphoglucomutase-like phosphatase (HAD superfamily)
MGVLAELPAIGPVSSEAGFVALEACGDGTFRVGADGVEAVVATGDRKVEFIGFRDHTLAYVASAMGYPAYYPVRPVEIAKPVKAVLMDLDGTSVHSEQFWVWIIEQTTARLCNDPAFRLAPEDLPFVSGHSVSEHFKYCIAKYCPHRTVEEARAQYFQLVHHEMREILEGRGKVDAFAPAPGLKEFLFALKDMGVKIALVTAGLYEKAYPEIVAAFRRLDMGDPVDFYDAIITAGFPLRKGEIGTLGELSPKPHPWLYAEACRLGLGIDAADRAHVVGIEDSGAGVCAIRLAGFAVIGMAGGNLAEGGTRGLCRHYCETFEEILEIIR